MSKIRYIKKYAVMSLALTLLVLVFSVSVKVKADETVAVTEIDYEKSTITVKLGSGDTELQISDSKQKTWETVTVDPVSGSVTFDISWIPVSKDYVLSLRGDKNKQAVKVKIPKQEKTLKVSYTAATGSLDITGDNGRTIQWRKKNSTKWKTYNPTTFSKTLEGLVTKGGTLVFRTAPVKGNATSAGLRPGKEISVAIKHKTAAPKVAIDDEKLTFKIEKGLEYRFCDEDGKVLDGESWKKVPGGSDILIEYLAPDVMAGSSADGKTVGLVCSGDAGVYGMASPMLEIAEEEGFSDIRIVPGITAALSGAAVLGAPIGHDFCVISLSDLLTPKDLIEKRLLAAASADLVIVIYNPASKTRKDGLKDACEVMLTILPPDRPCGYVRNIGRDGEKATVCTLAELAKADVDMSTTVFIGSSTTKTEGGKLITPRGYTIV